MSYKLTEEFLKKWINSARIMAIPEKAYNPSVRLIDGPYPFALFYNPYRNVRPENIKKSIKPGNTDCLLCEAIEESYTDRRILLETEHFILTPNKFPTVTGSSIAIHKSRSTDITNHIPMYRTTNLKDFEKILPEYLGISRATGLQMFHNGPGAGASIPIHEHCNFHNFSETAQRLGKVYGFEGAESGNVNKAENVSEISAFPFANLVFEEDPERIKHFLERLHEDIGYKFGGKGVPHVLSQGRNGILFVPAKIYIEGKGIGAGDVAGHILAASEQEFQDADYNYCVRRLGKTLFKKDELNLAKLL